MASHNKKGGIIPIAAFLAAVPGVIVAAAPYIATAAGAIGVVSGATHIINEIKQMFSKKGSGFQTLGKGLYDPVYGDDFIAAIKGSGCSCHKKMFSSSRKNGKGVGIYDPVYPDRNNSCVNRINSRDYSSNSNSRMRYGGYGLRDPVYGRGAKELLDKMGKKEFEKIAEKLRDSVMSLPEKVRSEMIDFFIKSGQ